ncbi:MAG: hypothetical protein II200_05290 [Bacteroidaceae bacterium]|nr:hypothetical protein [Bacteroidaceae bacterium]
MKHYIQPQSVIVNLETSQILAASQLEFGGNASTPQQESNTSPNDTDQPWATSWE